MKQSNLRAIPSVEKVCQALGETSLPRPLVVGHVRERLAKLRHEKVIPDLDEIIGGLRAEVQQVARGRIQQVINGTGILVHTNLGRSPLAASAVKSLVSAAENYSNLEFDLTTGARGSRAAFLENALAHVCGAEAATVVNNCAAALVLILRHFAQPPRQEVIISRGELVQIGGGFRIPEILESSGAVLKEVGTTNKTALEDYSKAISKNTGLILKVHRSNFFMGGFVDAPITAELAMLARKKRVPLVEDLGSGAIMPTEKVSLTEHEPTPAEVLKAGVDLICCSGDKLFGGPQAGIIAGKRKLVAALKKNPLFRALRCDKLVLSALEATTELYLRDQWRDGLPLAEMLRASPELLKARAEKILTKLAGLPLTVRIGQGNGQMGGGTLPRSTIPSITVDITPNDSTLEEWARRMRLAAVPIIGYISGGKFKIDLRTVFPRQDDLLVDSIAGCFP